jgi:hypothetical protein
MMRRAPQPASVRLPRLVYGLLPAPTSAGAAPKLGCRCMGFWLRICPGRGHRATGYRGAGGVLWCMGSWCATLPGRVSWPSHLVAGEAGRENARTPVRVHGVLFPHLRWLPLRRSPGGFVHSLNPATAIERPRRCDRHCAIRVHRSPPPGVDLGVYLRFQASCFVACRTVPPGRSTAWHRGSWHDASRCDGTNPDGGASHALATCVKHRKVDRHGQAAGRSSSPSRPHESGL